MDIGSSQGPRHPFFKTPVLDLRDVDAALSPAPTSGV